uniref:Putative secreted peptide n=1 Tax=Anopheles braziliensis TaxID=58242 RepID=A0A2M3ZSA6_9DIPT
MPCASVFSSSRASRAGPFPASLFVLRFHLFWFPSGVLSVSFPSSPLSISLPSSHRWPPGPRCSLLPCAPLPSS